MDDIRKANRTELAKFFGVNLTTIDRWLRQGMPYIQKPGVSGAKGWQFDLLECARWRFEGPSAKGDDPEKLPPKERLDWYRGERERLRLADEAGELVRVEVFERELSASLKVTSNTLEALPDMLGRDAGITPEAIEMSQKVIDGLRETLYNKIID